MNTLSHYSSARGWGWGPVPWSTCAFSMHKIGGVFSRRKGGEAWGTNNVCSTGILGTVFVSTTPNESPGVDWARMCSVHLFNDKQSQGHLDFQNVCLLPFLRSASHLLDLTRVSMIVSGKPALLKHRVWHLCLSHVSTSWARSSFESWSHLHKPSELSCSRHALCPSNKHFL